MEKKTIFPIRKVFVLFNSLKEFCEIFPTNQNNFGRYSSYRVCEEKNVCSAVIPMFPAPATREKGLSKVLLCKN